MATLPSATVMPIPSPRRPTASLSQAMSASGRRRYLPRHLGKLGNRDAAAQEYRRGKQIAIDRRSTASNSQFFFLTAGSEDFAFGTGLGGAGASDLGIYDASTSANAITITKSNGNVGIPSGNLTVGGSTISIANSSSDVAIGANYNSGARTMTKTRSQELSEQFSEQWHLCRDWLLP